MEVIDPSSHEHKVAESFEEVAPDKWAPVIPRKSTTPPTTWRPLMKDAQEKLAEAERFINNAHSQAKTQALPIAVEEILVYHAQRMQQRAQALRNAAAEIAEQATPQAEKNIAAINKRADDLESKALELIKVGRNIRIDMSKQQDPRINRLQYLIDEKEVSIRKVGDRTKIGPKNQQDWLQEYEIKDIKTKNLLWCAHFHYKQPDDLFGSFCAAHLKTKDHRHRGLTMQIAQEQRGEEVTPILRSKIDPAAAARIFENPR